MHAWTLSHQSPASDFSFYATMLIEKSKSSMFSLQMVKSWQYFSLQSWHYWSIFADFFLRYIHFSPFSIQFCNDELPCVWKGPKDLSHRVRLFFSVSENPFAICNLHEKGIERFSRLYLLIWSIMYGGSRRFLRNKQNKGLPRKDE